MNPSLVPGARGEAKAARRIAAECAAAGLTVDITEVAPGRPNVVAVLEGRTPGPTLMLCGHIDTVGVAGMDAPFRSVHRDGCLYGRGAQDMKGGVAAMLGAARMLAEGGGCRVAVWSSLPWWTRSTPVSVPRRSSRGGGRTPPW